MVIILIIHLWIRSIHKQYNNEYTQYTCLCVYRIIYVMCIKYYYRYGLTLRDERDEIKKTRNARFERIY